VTNQTLNTATNLFVQSALSIVTFDFSGNHFDQIDTKFGDLESRFHSISEIIRKDFINDSSNLLSFEESVYTFFKTGLLSLNPLNYEIAVAY